MRRLTGLLYIDDKIMGDIKEEIKHSVTYEHIILFLKITTDIRKSPLNKCPYVSFKDDLYYSS